MESSTGKGIGATLKDAAVVVDGRGKDAKDAWDRRDRRPGTGARRFGYVVGALVNAGLFYVVSSPLVWRIPFLTEGFVGPLAVIELSLIVSVVANLAFVVYDGAWFRHLGRMSMSAIAFVATYDLLSAFPFDFATASQSEAARVVLLIALVGTAIAVVVECFQLLFGWIRG